jgi:hypothetical protein
MENLVEIPQIIKKDKAIEIFYVPVLFDLTSGAVLINHPIVLGCSSNFAD